MPHKQKYTHFGTAMRTHCYCSGKAKIVYSTRDAAYAARNKHRAALRHKLQAMRAYRCPHREGWHLTSKPVRGAWAV